MRNVADKFVEEIKTYMLCPVTFFFPENCAFCEMKCEKFGRARRP
jgi:hypothetical protein